MHKYDFFRDIFSVFGDFSRFLGVKFGFRKSCLCKRNDKYKVCFGPDKTSKPVLTKCLPEKPSKAGRS